MKVLPFFSLTFLLALCFFSCNEQLAEEQFEANPAAQTDAVASKKAPPPYIDTVTPQCGKLGPTAKLFVTTTHFYPKIHIDVYTEDGFFLDRWTRLNPNLLPSLTIAIGTPPNGTKSCSLLEEGSTYRLAIIYGNNANDAEPQVGSEWPHGTWPNPFSSTGEDTLVTIDPCACTG